MRYMIAIALAATVMFTSGCGSSALNYARKKNPNCDVTVLAETKESVRVLIICPNRDPFERVYREQ